MTMLSLEKSTKASSENAEASSTTTILVVDDDATMRLLLRASMENEGFNVLEASNGVECIEVVKHQHPDIVLLDALMPEMDGFSCCTALQNLAIKSRPPILMITSLDDPGSVDSAFEVGAEDYVTKPIHWALLRQRVRRLQDILRRQQAEKQIKESLREKEALLREVHHRVKNNLQIISSLLNLQSHSIKDEYILSLFRESQNRVRLMALVHEKLYQSHNLEKISLAEYIQGLTSYLLRSYEVMPNTVQMVLEIDDISLAVDSAVSCGLIINELVSNSLKYAFPEALPEALPEAQLVAESVKQQGIISISAKAEDKGRFSISYRDSGCGLPDDIDIHAVETLGLQLIVSLTEQLGGDLEVVKDDSAQQGAAFRLNNLSL